jgi:probable HAF family extracellular repeat protein
MGPTGDVTTIDFPDAVETAAHNYADLGGMNRYGDIVSTYCSVAPCPTTAAEFVTFPGAVHGFLRTADGRFFSLDPPQSVGSQAFGINDRGVIVGGFIDATGHMHAFSCHDPH